MFRDALLDRSLRTLRVIWTALGVSLGTYVVVASRAVRTIPPAVPSGSAIVFVFYGWATIMVLMTLWWRRRFLSPEAMASTSTPSVPITLRIGVTAETDDERRALATVARFQAQSISVWALSESIAVFGLVLTLLTGEIQHVTTLAVVSLALLVAVHAPTRGRLGTVLAAIPS